MFRLDESSVDNKPGDSRAFLKRPMLAALLQKHFVDIEGMSAFLMQPFL